MDNIIGFAVLGFIVILIIYRSSRKEIASRGDSMHSGEEAIGKNFEFLICDEISDATPNIWYRLQRWESSHFLKMQTTWTKDWKTFASEVNVVGVTQGDREANFLFMGDQPDFKIFLKKEPNNPVDPNAVKVMGSATVDGEKMVAQLGYLPKEIAQELSNEKEIDTRPHMVYLPYEGKTIWIKGKNTC